MDETFFFLHLTFVLEVYANWSVIYWLNKSYPLKNFTFLQICFQFISIFTHLSFRPRLKKKKSKVLFITTSVRLKHAINPNFNLNPDWFAGVPQGYKFIKNITAAAEIKTQHSRPATSWATDTQWVKAFSQALWWNTKQPAGIYILFRPEENVASFPPPFPKCIHTHTITDNLLTLADCGGFSNINCKQSFDRKYD